MSFLDSDGTAVSGVLYIRDMLNRLGEKPCSGMGGLASQSKR
jgi:hypothetical protein